MKIHHICIQTENYRESLEFYTEVLEFTLIEETKNFHGRAYNSWLKLENFMIELQTNKEDEVLNEFDKHTKAISHFCLYSDNIEEEYKRIKKIHNNIFNQKNNKDIYTVNNGQLFKITAPEGTIIEIRDMIGI